MQPPTRHVKRSLIVNEVERLAALIVERMKAVYRPEYYDKCAMGEPDSLLGLIAQLDLALQAADAAKKDIT
jgi:hypothetical protein